MANLVHPTKNPPVIHGIRKSKKYYGLFPFNLSQHLFTQKHMGDDSELQTNSNQDNACAILAHGNRHKQR